MKKQEFKSSGIRAGKTKNMEAFGQQLHRGILDEGLSIEQAFKKAERYYVVADFHRNEVAILAQKRFEELNNL